MEEAVTLEPERSNAKWFFAVLGLGIFAGLGIIFWIQSRPVKVSDFKQCVAYGYPVTGSSPQICKVGAVTFAGSFVASPTPSSSDVPYQTVGSFTGSGTYPEKNDIIDDQASWQKYWDAVHAGSPEKPRLPSVDFSHKTVVGISEGPFHSDAVGIQILSVVATKDNIVVTAEEIKPGQTCAATATVLDPAVMIAFDTPKVPILVDLKPRSRQCS